MLRFLGLLFIIIAKIRITIEETSMADCNIYSAETFLPDTSTSLIETRQLLPSPMSTIADCALICLQSTSCVTAIFNSQMDTCKMFSEGLDSGGQLIPASSNDITTISVNKNRGKILNLLPVDKFKKRIIQ